MVCFGQRAKQKSVYTIYYMVYYTMHRSVCGVGLCGAYSLVDDGENSIMVSFLHLLFCFLVGNRFGPKPEPKR